MSIFKKISILFFISLTLMSIIGFWIDEINSKRIEMEEIKVVSYKRLD